MKGRYGDYGWFIRKMEVVWAVTGTLLCVLPAVRPLLRTSTTSTTRLASTALSPLPFMWWWAPCRSARSVSTNGRSTWWHKETQPRPHLTPDPVGSDQGHLHWRPSTSYFRGNTVGWVVRMSPNYLFSTLTCVLSFEKLYHSVNMRWKGPKR